MGSKTLIIECGIDCHISFVGTSQEFLTTEDRLTAAPRLAQIAGWAITVFVQLVTENELL